MAGQPPPNQATRLVVVDSRIDDYRCLSERSDSARLRLTLTTHGSLALRLAPSFADAVWLICPQLPDINGLELLEMLASLTPRLRAVVIDSEYDRDRESTALQLRAVQYVCKPMHPAWLEMWQAPSADPYHATSPPVSREETPTLRNHFRNALQEKSHEHHRPLGTRRDRPGTERQR
ncbi:MAG: hypothetical protein AAGJ46_11645 [Planctomycetota bacterium]